MAKLYHRAQDELRKQQKSRRSIRGAVTSEAGPNRLLHELQVHQVELELQNEELQATRNNLEKLLEQYTDLYDFAPVGYLSLDEAGRILKANLAGAVLLGIERSRLTGLYLTRLIVAEQQPAFHAFLRQVFAGLTRQSANFDLAIPGQQNRIVNLEAQRLVYGGECRAALSDITSRKRAEAALAASEERLRLSQEVAHVGTFDWDIVSGVNIWTPELEALYGLPPGGFTRTQAAWENLVHPNDRAAAIARVDEALRTGQTVESEWRVIWPDGSVHWLAGRFRAFKNKAGKSVRLAGVNIDITARKQAEEKVHISETRYRRLFEAAHDGVLLLDPGTRKITDANPFMTQLLGYPQEHLVGKELFEIGLLKDEGASREMFQKLKRNHEIRYEDLPLKSRQGRHQEVEVVANLYQENGHAVIQCNIRDITQRKLGEEILRRNEALFSALVAQAPVGVYVVDARFRLQQANPTARTVFKSVRPLIGRDFSEALRVLWPRPVADQVVKQFRHTLKTGEPYVSAEFAGQRRDTGKKEVYEWQIQRVTLPAGELGVVCFFSNITQRKRMESAQRRLDVMTASNRKLEREIVRRRRVERALRKSERHQHRLLGQSRQMQEQLRQLSHEVLHAQEEERKRISRELHDVIAQTLTGINVRLSALKIEASRDTRGLDRSINDTQQLVAKSVNIVHQFARELRPAVLDDLGLIPALHTFMKSFTERTGVRACLKASVGVEELDTTRRTVLFRVAQEALTNVARHAQASRVEIRIEKLCGGIRMKLADNGKSFPVKRVLGSRGNKRLGLLGMKERLEMVGGTFNIESAPGKGTTIEARIPLRDSGRV